MSTPAVETDYGYSYEYAVDINLGTATEPDWQFIRFSSAIDPQVTNVETDGATYDDHGAPHPVKLSESWTLALTVQQQRLPSGEYLPEVEKLLAAARPDAVGTAAVVHVRWYDNPAAGEPNPLEAYEGHANVSWTRAQTGNAEIGAWAFTLTGKGRRVSIDNPKSTGTGEGGGGEG